jgi:hypothetical protein
MRTKPYYSVRTGKNPAGGPIDLAMLTRQVLRIYNLLDNEGYFQEDLGYDCVDSGWVPGRLGFDLEAVVALELRKPSLLPIRTKLETYAYSEDDLFDMIEFLHEHCSKGLDNYYHSFNDCGYHHREFDRDQGRHDFREQINPLVAIYGTGYELSPDGDVLAKADAGFETLLEATLPRIDPENVEARVEEAKLKFRRHGSTLEDRRDALRQLADVLEFLRPKLRKVLMKADENDLLNIVNNFGIRHHNQDQKTNFDRGIWYSWLFYFFLAAIHGSSRLIKKAEGGH